MAEKPRPTPRPGASAPVSPPTHTPTGLPVGSRSAQQPAGEAGAAGETGAEGYGQQHDRGAMSALAAAGGAGMVPLGEVFQLAQWAVNPTTDEADAAARRSAVRNLLWSIIDQTFPE